MTVKMSAGRRAAFLKGLGRTGNYAVAAEQAGVSRNWVLKARHAEPGFDAACREAVAGARARLSAAGAAGRGALGHLGGVELVVRGTGGSGGGKRVQIGRARAHQWGPRTEETFLAALRWSCNVTAACAAVGMSKGAAYGHRRRWPGFARLWDQAIEEGYQRLLWSLHAAGHNLFLNTEERPEIDVGPLTVGGAIQLLRMHERRARGTGKAPGLRRTRPGGG